MVSARIHSKRSSRQVSTRETGVSAPLIGALVCGTAAGLIARTILARRRSAHSLRGQVVFITGGSRGLGLSLAETFANEGCRVAICARDAMELEAARRQLDHGGSILAVPCDVADQRQVERTVDSVIAQFGRIDVLVNNAGEIQVGPVQSMTLEDFENAMDVMFWGTVYPSMAVLPHVLERGTGRIVNITSIGGKVAVPHLLPYTCAKFAAVGFSEGLRAELAGKGIHVVTIAPGLMRTGSYLNALFKGDQEREAVWFSLGATLPGISMGARRAARQIVNATKRGDAERILTVPARWLARFHGLFPGLAADLLSVVNHYVLPSGTDKGSMRGREATVLRKPWMQALTVLGRIAARRFLEESKQQAAPARM